MRVCTALPVARSQMRALSSVETETARLASLVTATALTAAVWPVSVCRHCPCSMSHTRTVPSWLLVSSTVPASAAFVTGAVCPSMTSTQSPISMSHTLAVPSWETAQPSKSHQTGKGATCRHSCAAWACNGLLRKVATNCYPVFQYGQLHVAKVHLAIAALPGPALNEENDGTHTCRRGPHR